jgi:hypothetical protein
MNDVIRVAVCDSGNELLEVRTSQRVFKWAGESEEVEQFTAGCQFEDDEDDLNGRA